MEVRLSREMRLVDITMIGVGAMIGAGIFVLTGIAAGVAGPALIVAFLLNGFVALLTAMAYAELGSAFHDAGGGYLWVKTSLPDPNGFLSGWMSWFAHAVACSLYALGFGAYFHLVLQSFGVPEFQLGFMSLDKWLAVLACAAFAFINVRGASETGKAGNVVTVSKIAVIGAFVVAGLWAISQTTDWQVRFTPFFTRGWGGVFAAMGLSFIAFEGYEIIAQTSEEVEDPKRNVPRAVFLSLLIVVPIYLLVAFVAIGAVTPPLGMSVTQFLGREKELALVSAADQILAGGGVVILIGGLLSTLSALNATIYSSSRVAFAMGRDANLPAAVARVHEKRSTPHVAITLSALLIIGMAIWLPIEDVAAASDIMFLFLFMQVNVALIRLRKKRPDLDRGFVVPAVPLIPAIAIATMLVLTVFLFDRYPRALIATGGWIAVGAAVYYGYSRKREAAFLERERWMERIERKEYRVLVAISSPRTMRSLMEVGLALAQRHHGVLVVLTVAEVPEGETLMAGRHLARELEPLLEEAVAYAQREGAKVYPVVKIGRRVSHAIVETAREELCNFLVIGQPVAGSLAERLVASIVERVLRNAPCQVGIVYGKVDRAAIKGIVVPVTKGPNSQLAAGLAPAFAARFEVPARALTVIPYGLPEGEVQQCVTDAKTTLADADFPGSPQVLRRNDVLRGVSRAVRWDELTVIGAPSIGPVASLWGESVPSAIARHGQHPVVVVREVEQHRARRFERIFFAQE